MHVSLQVAQVVLELHHLLQRMFVALAPREAPERRLESERDHFALCEELPQGQPAEGQPLA